MLLPIVGVLVIVCGKHKTVTERGGVFKDNRLSVLPFTCNRSHGFGHQPQNKATSLFDRRSGKFDVTAETVARLNILDRKLGFAFALTEKPLQ
jgi:hypothetical protein